MLDGARVSFIVIICAKSEGGGGAGREEGDDAYQLLIPGYGRLFSKSNVSAQFNSFHIHNSLIISITRIVVQ